VPHGWYRASTGEWYGLVSFTTVSAGATRTPGLLDHQLVPAEAGWRTNAEVPGPVVPVRRKVVLDLAFALALGGDCLANIAVLRAEPGCKWGVPPIACPGGERLALS
jgi:hypothetical protein